jgi:glycosyltransferase involved in cell wall biosynthesis
MKISIITVCFNAQRTIAETITSVCSQNYHDLEYLVIDGSSTDQTVDVIRAHPQFSRITTFVSEPDGGIYDAMNKGISMASGEIIGLLNADDVYLDNTVLEQVAKVFEDQSIDACYADLIYVKQFDSSKIIRYWQSKSFRPGLFEKGWMPAHPTFFVRRKIYEKFGLFDLSFKRQADFELTMRYLAVHQIRTRYIPKIWVRMRLGGISNRNFLGVIKSNMEAYHACKKNKLKIFIAPLFILRKIASRIPQFMNRPK